MDLSKQFSYYMHRLNRKLQSSKVDVTWVFGVLAVIGFAIFWYKLNDARRRHEARRGGNNSNSSINVSSRSSRSATSSASSSSNLTNNEMRTINAFKRYFQMDSWKNQKICLCLMQFLESKNDSKTEMMFRENCLKILYNLIRRHRVYVVCEIPNNVDIPPNHKPSDKTEFEQNIIQLFETNGLISDEFPKYRILFCQTQKGKSAMVRQLAPTLYIDSDEIVLAHLYSHIPEMVQLTDKSSAMKPDMFAAPSIAKYFASRITSKKNLVTANTMTSPSSILNGVSKPTVNSAK